MFRVQSQRYWSFCQLRFSLESMSSREKVFAVRFNIVESGFQKNGTSPYVPPRLVSAYYLHPKKQEMRLVFFM